MDNIGELQALVAAEGGESKVGWVKWTATCLSRLLGMSDHWLKHPHTHTQAAVRDRAVRVLQLLGSAASASEQHQPATRATTTRRGPSPLAARQASLLEFDDEVEEEAAVTAAVPVPAPSSSGGAQVIIGHALEMGLSFP